MKGCGSRIAGLGLMLIILALCGIIAPLFGYQNRMIASAEEDWGIPPSLTILMIFIAGATVILFLAWVEWSAQKKRIEREERELKLKLKTIKCPNCGHEQSKDFMTCEQCGKMV